MAKAWVVSVDMGYGHQRAAYPLKDIANERIITANSDKIISERERGMWHRYRMSYEFLSRLRQVPFIGGMTFDIYDKFQSISSLFPFRDLSKPTFQVLFFKKRILKNGLCRSLIDYVKKQDIPFISTNFIPAIAAHYFGLKKIYCVVTDTDINRVWVPDKPRDSKIKYFAPCRHVVMRLKEYGIDEKNIFLTGFPLPKENIGGKNLVVLKEDLGERIPILDPTGVYVKRGKEILEKKLGKFLKKKITRALTIAYVVGGAGAERDIGVKIAKSLKQRIQKGSVNLILAAGTKMDVKSYFENELEKIGLRKNIGKQIKIIFALDKKTYFSDFNSALRKTDILWTKPSELSFYTALGLPIIIAPPVGAHERYNREWLGHVGSGFVQENPEFVNDWLFYWLEDGRLADAAFQGFLEAPVMGTYEIERLISGEKI